MRKIDFDRRLLIAVALAAPLAGCGSDSNDTPTTGTSTTGSNCTQTVVGSATGSAVDPASRSTVAFTTTAAGRLDITVDWTDASNPLGAYVVQAGSCSIDQFNAGSCTFATQSQTGGKPRLLSVANAAAGSYELLLVNTSKTASESVSAQVVLSQGSSCPAFTPNGVVGPGALGQVSEGARVPLR
jgi:hypothetical protein